MSEGRSLKRTFGLVISVILVLLAIGLYFQFNYVIFPGKDKIVYIMPTNCPEQVCNIDSLRTWVKDIDVDLGIYNSNSVAVPTAIVFKSNDAFGINTLSKRAFSNDLCVLINSSNACNVFERSIQKTDVATLNFFTSLFSINDVRLKLIAVNLKNILKDSVNVIPRFIIVSNLDDPASANVAEVQEVARQLCMLRTQPNNWVQYATCIDNALLNNQWTQATWQSCAQAANIDVDSLNACVQTNGLQLVANEQTTVRQLQLTTAPVLFINNDVYTSQFTFDAVKKTVCLYLRNKTEGC